VRTSASEKSSLSARCPHWTNSLAADVFYGQPFTLAADVFYGQLLTLNTYYRTPKCKLHPGEQQDRL